MTKTLRDEFAIAALTGLLAATTAEDVARFNKMGYSDQQRAAWIARMAFMTADAMMARHKPTQPNENYVDTNWTSAMADIGG